MEKAKDLRNKSCSYFYPGFYSYLEKGIKKMVTAGILTLSFFLSLNSYGTVNTIQCIDTHTVEFYNRILEKNKNNLTPSTRYTLGTTAICIGRYSDGLNHLRIASERGHVVATTALGDYYNKNQSFDNNQSANLENTYKAISYYEKAADQIEAISSYPEGSSIEYISFHEYRDTTSYYVFTALPLLYFNVYSIVVGKIMEDNTFHADTIGILQELGDAAIRCLKRPALSVWKEKKSLVYKAQQIQCQANLNFVEAAYPLENERIQIANNCKVSLAQCEQHQKKIEQLIEEAQVLFRELEKAPSWISTTNVAKR